MDVRSSVALFRFFLISIILPSLSLARPLELEPAKHHGDELRAVFFLDKLGSGVQLSGAGVLSQRVPKENSAGKSLQLPMKKLHFIERVSSIKLLEDVLIAFEATDGEVVGGQICRVRLERLSILWCQQIPTVNVYAVLGAENSIYLGGIGFLSRLKVVDGKYVWRQNGLYEKYHAFETFCGFIEEEEKVSFLAPDGYRKPTGKRITLAKKTGKIIEISKLERVSDC